MKYLNTKKKGYQTLYKNIGTKYRVSNDSLVCLDCEKEIKLKKTKPNTVYNQLLW